MPLLALVSVLLSSCMLHATAASVWGPRVILVSIEGTIDGFTAEYVKNAIAYARRQHYPIILYIDTPGGYLDASLRIVRVVDESGVPVIAYAGGQWAVSAGTLILVSSPVAYAAPHTVIGSMQPVIITPEGVRPINQSKIINTLLKILEVHCEVFGRNCTAVKLFVTRNLNLDGMEAARYHVIDGVAHSVAELIARINGTRVKLFKGDEVVLLLSGEIVEYEMPMSYRFARILSDPTISSILFSLGSLILILSIVSGHWHSAPLGLLLLLLALMGLGYNINIMALVMIILGAILLVVELTAIPGFGIVGITGIIMIILGAAFLPLTPNLLISRRHILTLLYLTGAVGVFFAILTSIVAYKIVRTLRKPVVTQPVPIGKTGYAVDEITPERTGFVKIEGEYWEARSKSGVIKPGEKVRVVSKEGHILVVERVAEGGGSGG